MIYVFRQCTFIVLILQFQKAQDNCQTVSNEQKEE